MKRSLPFGIQKALCVISLLSTPCHADDIEELAEKIKTDLREAKKTPVKQKVVPPALPVLAERVSDLFGSPYFQRDSSHQGLQPLLRTWEGIPLNSVSHAFGHQYVSLASTPELSDATQVRFSYLGFADFEAAARARAEIADARIDARMLRGRGRFQSTQNLKGESVRATALVPTGSQGEITTSFLVDRHQGSDAGFLPSRAEGEWGRFAVTDPTGFARTEEYLLSTRWNRDRNDAEWEVGAFGGRQEFQDFSNATFLLTDTARGDQREWKDERWIYGGRARYARLEEGRETKMKSAFQAEMAMQNGTSAIYRTEARERIAPVSERDLIARRISLRASQDIQWNNWIKTDASVGIDQWRLSDQTGEWNGLVVSPRAKLELDFEKRVTFRVNTSLEGRPRDVRALESGAGALTSVVQYEGGLSAEVVRRKMRLDLAVFGSSWGDEPVYDPLQNKVSRYPRRNHLGLETKLTLTPWSWLESRLSLVVQRARFSEAFERGDRVPYVPQRILEGLLLGKISNHWNCQVGVRFIGERALSSDLAFTGKPFTLGRLGASYESERFIFGVGIENLLDTQWNETEAVVTNKLSGEAVAVEDVLVRPGSPFRITGNLTVLL